MRSYRGRFRQRYFRTAVFYLLVYPAAHLSVRTERIVKRVVKRTASATVAAAFLRGKVNRVKQITAVKVKQAQIVAHGETAIQADGEIYQNTPLDVTVAEAKLNFYLP